MRKIIAAAFIAVFAMGAVSTASACPYGSMEKPKPTTSS